MWESEQLLTWGSVQGASKYGKHPPLWYRGKIPHRRTAAGGHMDGRTAAGAGTGGERGQGQRLRLCVSVYLVSGYRKTCQQLSPSFPLSFPSFLLSFLFPPPSPCQLRTMTADIEKPYMRLLCPFTIPALDTCGKTFSFIEKCKSLQWRVCCTLARPARPFTAVLQDGV